MENGRKGVLTSKSYDFALRAVNLYKYLVDEKREFVLSKQVLRSGTSTGAKVVEARQAQSRADFIHKLSISLKESFETEYWLDLLRDAQFITKEKSALLIEDCKEFQKMLTASIKTAELNNAGGDR